MKLYEVFIGDYVRQNEYEVSEAEFNKTFNYIKLKIKNNILSVFLSSINDVDLQFTNLFVISLKPFSDEDIEKLAIYIWSHNKE